MSQRGFTLIEVLVTMSLLGIVFVLLGGVTVQQIKTTERLSEQAFLQQDVRHSVSIISSAIREANTVDKDLSDNGVLPVGVSVEDLAIYQNGVTKYVVLDSNKQLRLFNDYASVPDSWVSLTAANTEVTVFEVADSNNLWEITVTAKRVLKNGQEESFSLNKEVGQRIQGFN